MRVLLKIIAAPFVVILTVLWLALNFLFCICAALLFVACGIGVLLSIVFLCGGYTANGLILLTLSFLISPFGLPLIANWLIEKVGALNFSLRNFITA